MATFTYNIKFLEGGFQLGSVYAKDETQALRKISMTFWNRSYELLSIIPKSLPSRRNN